MYHEARTDRKLESLSDAEHRVWFNLICFAAAQEQNRGEIHGYDLELLAVEVARGDTVTLQSTLDHLQRLRIVTVEADVIAFLHFRKRQYSKPSDEPEAVKARVTKSRQAKRNAIKKDEHAVKRDVTPSNAIDTESESESERIAAHAAIPGQTEKIALFSAADAASSERVLTLQQQTWAALRVQLGYEPSKTNRGERSGWNGAIRGLLTEGELPDTIPELVTLYRVRWPGIDCTPMALLNKLALIRSPPPVPAARNGRALPLEPHYQTREESVANQERLKREQDAYFDRMKRESPLRMMQ